MVDFSFYGGFDIIIHWKISDCNRIIKINKISYGILFPKPQKHLAYRRTRGSPSSPRSARTGASTTTG